ncbi:substrate-binding domain-containing protein [Marivita sp.]|uniref:substrate-binding domain-containing protein n=1 Tax=Marivita sp. TaxID=2003365 RepID=UPI0034584394
MDVSTDTLLHVMLAESTRFGTSTPKADTSGDRAFALFKKSGHMDALKRKALQLTGGPIAPSRHTGATIARGCWTAIRPKSSRPLAPMRRWPRKRRLA